MELTPCGANNASCDKAAITVMPEARVRMGDALAVLSRTVGLTNKDFEVFDQVRDTTPAKPLRFE